MGIYSLGAMCIYVDCAKTVLNIDFKGSPPFWYVREVPFVHNQIKLPPSLAELKIYFIVMVGCVFSAPMKKIQSAIIFLLREAYTDRRKLVR